uniref:PpiC domain-containing protein n=1 Tax=Eubacterium plexicaudatum ASF492 TaxID=1235802 RepID=N2ABG9_9FIRM
MKLKKIMATLLAAAMITSFTITGCGSKINADAVAATLDGKDISMGVANFMAQYQAAQTDLYFLSYYGEDMWSTDSGDGSTMTDSVKDSVMENIRECYLLDAHAADYKIELTEEEKTAITEAASKFLADNSAQAIQKMGATQEIVEEMLRLNKVQSKMRAAIQEEIDTEVSEEECAQKTFSYVRFDKTAASDTTTDDTAADDVSDADAEKDNMETAEQFLKDAAENMEEAAEKEEYTVLKCSYGAGDLNEDDNTTSMDVEVLKAADQLKEGKLAKKVIETDSGYYVIRMDSTDDKEAAKTKKESILTQRRNDKYAETIEKYKEDSKWNINESEWKKVNFDELYTAKQEDTTTSTDDSTTDDSTTDQDNTGTDDTTSKDE